MIRYVCTNPSCLNTFLSPDLDIFKKCELCGKILDHFGIPERDDGNIPYPPEETIEELKIKYIKFRDKALKEGLTKEECLTVGRAIRKIPFQEREKLLRINGLWKDNVVYKHIMDKNGLLKMVENKRAIFRQRKMKNENKSDDQ